MELQIKCTDHLTTPVEGAVMSQTSFNPLFPLFLSLFSLLCGALCWLVALFMFTLHFFSVHLYISIICIEFSFIAVFSFIKM